MLPNIEIENRITELCPDMQIGLIKATVTNSQTPDALWEEINVACDEVKQKYMLLDINKRPAIAATRSLYRALGKEVSVGLGHLTDLIFDARDIFHVEVTAQHNLH